MYQRILHGAVPIMQLLDLSAHSIPYHQVDALVMPAFPLRQWAWHCASFGEGRLTETAVLCRMASIVETSVNGCDT